MSNRRRSIFVTDIRRYSDPISLSLAKHAASWKLRVSCGDNRGANPDPLVVSWPSSAHSDIETIMASVNSIRPGICSPSHTAVFSACLQGRSTKNET